jgi:tetratricopeptide (TPR) repeat protein
MEFVASFPEFRCDWIGNNSITQLSLLKKELHDNPTNLLAAVKIAELYLKKKNYPKAFYWLELARSKQAHFDYFYLITGDYYSEKSPDKALNFYLKALKLSDKKPRYFFSVARQNFQMERFEEAFHWTNLGLKIHSDCLQLKILLGLIYCKLKHWKNATTAFLEARELNPDHAETLYNLALVQTYLKDWELALKFLRDSAFCGFHDYKKINSSKQFLEFQNHPQFLLIQEQIRENQLRYNLHYQFKKI